MTAASGATGFILRRRANSLSARLRASSDSGVSAMASSSSAHSGSIPPSAGRRSSKPRPASGPAPPPSGSIWKPICSSSLRWISSTSISRARIDRSMPRLAPTSVASSSSCFSAVPTSRWPATRCESLIRSPIFEIASGSASGIRSERRAYRPNISAISAARAASAGSADGSTSYSHSASSSTAARKPSPAGRCSAMRARPSPSITTRAVPSARCDTCTIRMTVPARYRSPRAGFRTPGSLCPTRSANPPPASACSSAATDGRRPISRGSTMYGK